MSELKYKVGDKVRIKSLDWYNKNKDKNGSVFANGMPFSEAMSEYCGAYVRIADVYDGYYVIKGVPFCWTDDMIECLTDAYYKLGIVPTKKGSELIPHEDYEIKQDGEKFYLVKKKKEYPKTYEECAKVLLDRASVRNDFGYKGELLVALQKLLVCRDAYWKIAGEETGLGKPWKPYWSIYEHKFCLGTDKDKVIEECVTTGNRILAFPTAELRDAFYENFKELIESCKELL